MKPNMKRGRGPEPFGLSPLGMRRQKAASGREMISSSGPFFERGDQFQLVGGRHVNCLSGTREEYAVTV